VPSGDPALGRIALAVHAPGHKPGGGGVALFEERDLARWGRAARAWLVQDERRRTIGLVVLSVTVSIAVSLIVTAVVGLVSRRRAPVRGDVPPPDVGEPLAEFKPTAGSAVGIPVMAAERDAAAAEAAEGVGA
jgi:hypothetical protein